MKFLLLAVIGFLLLFSAKSYKLSSYSIDVLETDAVSELNDVSEVKNVSTTVAAPIFPYTVELVVAGFKSDNTTWLEDNFQHWNLSIYTVDDPAAVLSAPLDKGGDSMAYLSCAHPAIPLPITSTSFL